jgi:dTDP-4-amino-4,6-dideoxygalactose transaminase
MAGERLMTYSVPLIAPSFPAAEDMDGDYRDILDSGRFSNFGPFERAFRAALEDHVGQSVSAVTFSSATTALQAAMLACVDRGSAARDVLVPAFTFPAGPQSIAALGFTPRFVDIEPVGLHADPDAAARILKRDQVSIAGIVIGNSFGTGAHHISAWEDLAGEFDVALIIDSAAGFGSAYEDGTALGARGTCEIFSFHATKPLAIGEGGAVLTRDPDLAERLRRISNFGLDDDGVARLPGLNGKLNEFAAAIGIRQLAGLEADIVRRRAVHDAYRTAVADVDFQRNAERSALGFVSLVLSHGTDRDAVVGDLAARAIEARRYYAPAVHRSDLFAGGAPLPVTEDIEGRVISLPSHRGVTPAVVEAVAEAISARRS